MSIRRTLTALAIAGVLATGSASADTILTFGQSNDGSPIVGVNDGSGSTTITASAVPVTITQILAGIADPIDAFLQLDATSISAATMFGGQVLQEFAGSFSITDGATNYLSGTFANGIFAPTVAGGIAGAALTLNASQPNNVVTFTSNVIAAGLLGSPLAIAFSFADVFPGVGITSGSLSSFNSSVSGTFSAEPVDQTTTGAPTTGGVPEPFAAALFGVGLAAFAYRRRQA